MEVQVPVGQFRHWEADERPVARENVPIGQHDEHTLDKVAPDVVENVPATQPVHDDAPVVDDHVPAGQFTQRAEDAAPAEVVYFPAAQAAQALADVAPAVDDHVPELQ